MFIWTKNTPRNLLVVLTMMASIQVASGAHAADFDAENANATPSSPENSSQDRVSAPTPIGIYGVNQPKQGHFTVSANASYFYFSGSQIGTQSIAPAAAVTNPNVTTTYGPKVGVPTQVRNVPASVARGKLGFGLTYGVTKDFAVTVSSSYINTKQDVNVFKGSSGSTLLGLSDASVSGIGDTSVVGLYRLYHDTINQINVSFGAFLPTGSSTEMESGFNNSGVTSTHRAVYTLQLGTGTVDALPGITYSGILGKQSWGLSFRGRYALDTNSQGYSWGNYNEFDGWVGYNWLPGVSTTLTVRGQIIGHINGYDPLILGVGPCSNPLWFGGEYVDLRPGLSVAGKYFGIPAASVSLGVDVPIYQDLNGLHTARNYGVMTGFKFKF